MSKVEERSRLIQRNCKTIADRLLESPIDRQSNDNRISNSALG